ncbi:MAG: adenosylcobinamide-phosphate synthase CbiB [Candidatus Marinarcus sp.]|uniref:adenosylcobinamide-phosphate synthase CbiB n=1 Tax=Candidatus Marinarcus sp. TaxID=3100987 RepID=UPI003B00FF15
MFVEITLIAYLIDMIFGEFKFIRHPVVLMGNYIKWFEKHKYKNSVVRGGALCYSLVGIVFVVAFLVEKYVSNVFVLGLIASTGIASKMLFDAVLGVLNASNPKEQIALLVSRDTKDLSPSDIHKASIETYAENLSDGVIAPLFYLLLFGLPGLFVYKAVNTLDSMVGYRNERYEKFGKVSARWDDILNYVPARITALLIALLFASKEAMTMTISFGKLHESPNAGYPISAMALSIGVQLGGPTSYFGKIKDKPYFGIGRVMISKEDVLMALSLKYKLDIFIIVFLGVLYVI